MPIIQVQFDEAENELMKKEVRERNMTSKADVAHIIIREFLEKKYGVEGGSEDGQS